MSAEAAERLIDRQLKIVATTAANRHSTLYRAAFAIGGALHVAGTPPERALNLLTSTAEGVGLPRPEALRTARDGLSKGAQEPLGLGRSRAFKPALAIPALPPDPGKRDLALDLWSRVNREDRHVAAHPYCQKKLVRHAFGAGRVEHKGRDLLCVPVKRDGVGELLAVQTIDADGQKRTYGRLEDAYLLLGDERDTRHPWIACEGWATAHGYVVANTVNRTPAPVLVCFGSRLEQVARTARETYGATVVCMPDGEDYGA